MRYPHFLPEGGTIAFAAPSFGCAMEPYRTAFDHAQEVLRGKGHRLVLGPGCYAAEGIGISRAPALCGQEINELYTAGDSDVLISCGGGEMMCEILDYVDFDALRAAEPKWFMGFSDNTNLTFLLPTLCDTASIYGPCAGAFGMEPWHPAVQDAYDVLRGRMGASCSAGAENLPPDGPGESAWNGTSVVSPDAAAGRVPLIVHNYPAWERGGDKSEENPLAPYRCTEPVRIKVFRPGTTSTTCFSGRLIGGCLDCLVNLAGTVYDRVADFNARYADDGIVWFLEACDLNVFAIRRAVWELKHAGWFDHAKGFLIGRPLCFGQEMMGLDQYRAVTDILQDLNVPVIMDVDLGHLPPMMPLICGSIADVTCAPVDGNTYDLEIAMSLQ